MRKFLLSLSIFSCLIFSFALADTTIDLSEYDLPDLVIVDGTTTYSNVVLTSTAYVMSSLPMTASTNYDCPEGCSVTMYELRGTAPEQTWSRTMNGDDNGGADLMNYREPLYANYTIYSTSDPTDIVYQPIQNGGDGTLSTILTDLGTVLTSILTNATSLVTWISSNPLVYLWVIMAIIIAIISFVRGFIRGV